MNAAIGLRMVYKLDRAECLFCDAFEAKPDYGVVKRREFYSGAGYTG